MAYSELIKNFERIRDYMREFYVYGFKSREEYTAKSARSYDDERRRIESWLGDYMQFYRTADGKNVFLSIDSREVPHNPFYKALKTKSFTDGDITLHFLLFDILKESGEGMTLSEIMGRLDSYLSEFPKTRTFDESTVRKKLKEYEKEGIVIAEKSGKKVLYQRAEMSKLPETDVLDFFSEIAPCGVVGSFLLDKCEKHAEHFACKHHYITAAMDSDILCSLFLAMQKQCNVTITRTNRYKNRIIEEGAVPLRIMISVQNGRQYLMTYLPDTGKLLPLRIDYIVSVTVGTKNEHYTELRRRLDRMLPHIWGVSTQNRSGAQLEQVDFTVTYTEEEQYIRNRLEREKRCGTVWHIDAHTSRFSAEVYDASELIPWIRTFICRITELNCSNKKLEAKFWQDIKSMYDMYGLEGGDDDGVQ